MKKLKLKDLELKSFMTLMLKKDPRQLKGRGVPTTYKPQECLDT